MKALVLESVELAVLEPRVWVIVAKEAMEEITEAQIHQIYKVLDRAGKQQLKIH